MQAAALAPVPAARYPWFGWLFAIPADVPKHTRRYYLYWQVFYIIAGLGHASALALAAVAGVTLLAWFNVSSVTLFALAVAPLRCADTATEPPTGWLSANWSPMASSPPSGSAR